MGFTPSHLHHLSSHHIYHEFSIVNLRKGYIQIIKKGECIQAKSAFIKVKHTGEISNFKKWGILEADRLDIHPTSPG